jgi:hypothetical protein
MKLLVDLIYISGIQTLIDKETRICVLEKFHLQEDAK